jgi:hypothetical protein
MGQQHSRALDARAARGDRDIGRGGIARWCRWNDLNPRKQAAKLSVEITR